MASALHGIDGQLNIGAEKAENMQKAPLVESIRL